MKDETMDGIARKIIELKHDYYRIAYSFCNNKDDSMDAISDMTLIVLKKYGSLKNDDAFKSWSIKILVNACKRIIKNRRININLDDIEAEADGSENFHDSSSDLNAALAAVKPAFREVVIMKEILELSFREIAGILGIPVRTAQSRYNYGIKSLRGRLGDYFDEEIG